MTFILNTISFCNLLSGNLKKNRPFGNLVAIGKVNQSHYRPELPRGFQEVKVPRLRDNGPEWWQDCYPYAPAVFTPWKYSWYSFLLEAQPTPGP